jgi:dolichyl-phosphate beta-glucosyltransferase
MGQVFHWVVNLLLGLRAHDTQCGCKLVPRHAFEEAKPSLSLTGFAFDLDLLVGLRAHGCEIVEVPVDWHEVPGGKIRLMRDSWRMLRDVIRIRQRVKAEAYRPATTPP